MLNAGFDMGFNINDRTKLAIAGSVAAIGTIYVIATNFEVHIEEVSIDDATVVKHMKHFNYNHSSLLDCKFFNFHTGVKNPYKSFNDLLPNQLHPRSYILTSPQDFAAQRLNDWIVDKFYILKDFCNLHYDLYILTSLMLVGLLNYFFLISLIESKEVAMKKYLNEDVRENL
jgi:hypothetical protein